MAVTDINSLTYGANTFNLKDPTKYTKPSGGIPQSDLEQTVKNKLDKTVVVSNTQPTETENKLWVDTDGSSGNSYQVPTVAEMQAADNSILGNLAMIESSPATQAHAVGDYIVYNGQLYKVTAAISAGESLTVGTNVESTTVGENISIFHEPENIPISTMSDKINSITAMRIGSIVHIVIIINALTAGWHTNQIITIDRKYYPKTVISNIAAMPATGKDFKKVTLFDITTKDNGLLFGGYVSDSLSDIVTLHFMYAI